MEPSKITNGRSDMPKYIDFSCLEHGTVGADAKPALNRWSAALTNGHDFSGAQAMLYAAGVPNRDMMKNAPHVGIATVWWEGNPCNMHLHDLGKIVKEAVSKQGMLGWQYGTVYRLPVSVHLEIGTDPYQWSFGRNHHGRRRVIMAAVRTNDLFFHPLLLLAYKMTLVPFSPCHSTL
ncbi:dihydroxy-acid [Hyphodiscus hymeniophilus]|uniref:Dihydroxy-acid n=1 Tax=Hyphodiscus hymeniophilus TaxID=353542 RepID=A0A9P7AX14_9HELO|nr:dihydroxy-acid [Hyphodiscus hymeniophilus]